MISRYCDLWMQGSGILEYYFPRYFPLTVFVFPPSLEFWNPCLPLCLPACLALCLHLNVHLVPLSRNKSPTLPLFFFALYLLLCFALCFPQCCPTLSSTLSLTVSSTLFSTLSPTCNLGTLEPYLHLIFLLCRTTGSRERYHQFSLLAHEDAGFWDA